MQTVLQIFLSSILALSLMASSAFALALGRNITIYDGVSNSQNWYGINEDQEVEPGCVANQSWDLEGFFLNGSMLTMVGGFDFENGHPNHPGQTQSDMFIDIDNDARYGTANTGSQSGDGYQEIMDNFNYEYAINFNFADNTYNLFGLSGASTVSVIFDQNEESNPLKYVSGGETLNGGSFSYYTGLTDSDVGGLEGGLHNAISLNLGIGNIPGVDLEKFTAHYTMYCGNDNLMGSPVPEPASMMLFGTGLIGLAAFTRRKLNFKK